MKRKIELMHELFGVDNLHVCKECTHMPYRNQTNCYQKCDVYGNTSSEASDWAKSYTACGMFNKEYNGIPVMKEFSTRKEKVTVDGQLSFLDNK